MIVCNEEVIYSYHFPPTLQTAEATGTQVRSSLKQAVGQYEREMIVDALKSTRGNCTKAAKLLQTTQRIPGYKIRKYGIVPGKYKV